MNKNIVLRGNMHLTVEEARLTNDTEIIGKMDPYVKINFNGKKYKTHTKDEAGKNPKWRFKMELFISDVQDKITFKVMDQDMFTSDTVGKVTCSI